MLTNVAFSPCDKEDKIMSSGAEAFWQCKVKSHPFKMNSFGSTFQCLIVFTWGKKKMENEERSPSFCCVTATACCLSLSARRDQVHCLQDYQGSIWTSYECKLIIFLSGQCGSAALKNQSLFLTRSGGHATVGGQVTPSNKMNKAVPKLMN